ncbi:MAG: hypothetical protein SFT68_01000, partial [Rickettsiaceae bacterium]|nr:hypothetical protein [Rickettsiaceae bacterium]
MTKRINDIIEALALYDSFIIDVYGVLHDGIDKYHNVERTIEFLEKHNKNYVFLSNAPRPSDVLYRKLQELELSVPEDKIVTSGRFFIDKFKNDKIYSEAKYFILGEEYNADLLRDLKVNRTNKIEEADFILSLMFTEDEKAIS